MSWDEVKRLADANPDHQRFSEVLDEQFGTEAAVVISDMGRFSSRTRKYGIAFIFRLFIELDTLARPVVARHHGRIYKKVGDDFFIRFSRGVDAVKAVIELQALLAERNAQRPKDEEIMFCVGIGEGHFLEIEDDLWGAQLNETSKLGEDLADSDDVLITDACFQKLPPEWQARFAREEVEVSRILLTYHRLVARD